MKIDCNLTVNQNNLMSQTQSILETTVVHYESFNDPSQATIIMGIRGVTGSENVYVSGTSATGMVNGLLYEGSLAGGGSNGTWYELHYTSAGIDDVTSTSCYGPNNGPGDNVQIVGAYVRSSTGKKNHGFYYEGPKDGTGTWITVSPNGGDTNNVFIHSVMGRLAVGNYDFGNNENGRAFIYDTHTKMCTDFMVPDSLTTTLYGIWHNGGNSYTLAGGYSAEKAGELSQAFLVDYDAESKTTSNLKSFSYNNEKILSVITHFEGITIADDDGYNMPADWLNVKGGPKGGAAFVSVKRNQDGSFGEANWVDIAYPGAEVTSANTAYRNNILGIYVTSDGSGTTATMSYCATVAGVK